MKKHVLLLIRDVENMQKAYEKIWKRQQSKIMQN